MKEKLESLIRQVDELGSLKRQYQELPSRIQMQINANDRLAAQIATEMNNRNMTETAIEVGSNYVIFSLDKETLSTKVIKKLCDR